MDIRMTQMAVDGQTALLAPEFEEKYSAEDLIHILLQRLSRYENTGCTPEQCFMNKLIADTWNDIQYENMQWLVSIVGAHKEGRVLVLPCPIGSKVYIVGSRYRNGRMEKWVNTGKFRITDLDKLWDRVFLTEEAARQRLAKIDGIEVKPGRC